MHLYLFFLLGILLVPRVLAQDTTEVDEQRGFTLAGFPALNYSSDEGIGYGARLAVYNHGDGGYNPYRYLLDGNVFLTTRGRSQAFIFVDSPFLLGAGHRVTGEVQYQRYGQAPYYSIGNETPYQPALTDNTSDAFIDEHYYHFDRRRVSGWVTYQRRFGVFGMLGGVGVVYTRIGSRGSQTLLAREQPAGMAGGFTNYVKVGLVHDTRDFEPAPTRGDWTDVIASVSNGLVGSDYTYARLTLTQRHYFPLLPGLVLAERLIAEKGLGNMPFYEMPFFESSFRMHEGVGGGTTVRGLPQDRLIGPSKVIGNLELRWRLFEFRGPFQQHSVTVSGFYDFGRVYRRHEPFSLRGLHSGYGGGLHFGMGEAFNISIDAATSTETNWPIYVDVGYLF